MSRPPAPVRRVLVLVAGVAAVAVAALRLPVERLPAAAADLGIAALVAAVAIGALLLSALVPRTAISLACGALFGVLAGAVCALAAAMLAATATFALGRWLGREFIAGRAGGRIGRLDRWLADRGMLAVLAVRLLPIAPFGLVGYACGSSAVRSRHYLLATLAASVVPTVSYAMIGSAVVAPGGANLVAFLPGAVGVLITTGIAVHFRRTARIPGPQTLPRLVRS